MPQLIQLARPKAPQAPTLLASLSVFLPAHDERDNIVPAVESWMGVLPGVARRWEVIVVDDGSRDGTAMLVRALARRHPGHVRLVRHPVNRGYGAALRSGFAAARYDYVFFTDADRQFDPAGLGSLIPALDGADVVIGWRWRRADAMHRRLFSAVWNRLACRLVGVAVRDVNCAFKLFRRTAIQGMRLECDGATVSAELLARLARRGHRVVEVPVAHFPRPAGTPSGGRPDVILRALRELVGVRRRLRAERAVPVPHVPLAPARAECATGAL